MAVVGGRGRECRKRVVSVEGRELWRERERVVGGRERVGVRVVGGRHCQTIRNE